MKSMPNHAWVSRKQRLIGQELREKTNTIVLLKEHDSKMTPDDGILLYSSSIPLSDIIS